MSQSGGTSNRPPVPLREVSGSEVNRRYSRRYSVDVFDHYAVPALATVDPRRGTEPKEQTSSLLLPRTEGSTTPQETPLPFQTPRRRRTEDDVEDATTRRRRSRRDEPREDQSRWLNSGPAREPTQGASLGRRGTGVVPPSGSPERKSYPNLKRSLRTVSQDPRAVSKSTAGQTRSSRGGERVGDVLADRQMFVSSNTPQTRTDRGGVDPQGSYRPLGSTPASAVPVRRGLGDGETDVRGTVPLGFVEIIRRLVVLLYTSTEK